MYFFVVVVLVKSRYGYSPPSPRKFVVCAGMPRSGSTYLHNAAREILLRCEESSRTPKSGWWSECVGYFDAPAHSIVVKIHEMNAALYKRATHVLLSHRRLSEVCVSMRRYNWRGSSQSEVGLVRNLRYSAKHYLAWKAGRYAYDQDYGDMRRDPIENLRNLSRALGCGGWKEIDFRAIHERLESDWIREDVLTWSPEDASPACLPPEQSAWSNGLTLQSKGHVSTKDDEPTSCPAPVLRFIRGQARRWAKIPF